MSIAVNERCFEAWMWRCSASLSSSAPRPCTRATNSFGPSGMQALDSVVKPEDRFSAIRDRMTLDATAYRAGDTLFEIAGVAHLMPTSVVTPGCAFSGGEDGLRDLESARRAVTTTSPAPRSSRAQRWAGWGDSVQYGHRVLPRKPRHGRLRRRLPLRVILPICVIARWPGTRKCSSRVAWARPRPTRERARRDFEQQIGDDGPQPCARPNARTWRVADRGSAGISAHQRRRRHEADLVTAHSHQ